MRVEFTDATLPALDELGGVCLLVTSFVDDRPLRGLAGQVDWRLNGRLSRLILDEFIDAHYQEATLSPLDGRLPFQRLLVVGLGRRADYGPERFAATCSFCFRTLARMGVTDFAMAMPGHVGLDVGLRPALAGWREALLESFDAQDVANLRVTILEPVEVQRELAEPMRAIAHELHEFANQELEARASAGRSGARRRGEPSAAVAQQVPGIDAAQPAAPAAPPTGRRRGWQTGVVRIGVPITSVVDEDGRTR